MNTRRMFEGQRFFAVRFNDTALFAFHRCVNYVGLIELVVELVAVPGAIRVVKGE